MPRKLWVQPSEPLMPERCKNCGEDDQEKFVWHVGTTIRNPMNSGDGWLKLSEVAAMAYLGCETCSETLRVVSANVIEDILDWGTHG